MFTLHVHQRGGPPFLPTACLLLLTYSTPVWGEWRGGGAVQDTAIRESWDGVA